MISWVAWVRPNVCALDHTVNTNNCVITQGLDRTRLQREARLESYVKVVPDHRWAVVTLDSPNGL